MDESRTFAQAVQARLATDILNGHLAPGTRLRLQGLCETYQVSMSPLREALAGLAGRGLVVQEGQRGFRVTPASAADLADVTETRVRLEISALRLSIERGGDEWEASVLAANHRLSRKPRSEACLIDEPWEELHRAYHMALIAACGLPRLLGFCRMLHDHFDRYRRLAVLRAGRHPVLSPSHAEIVAAALDRQAQRAESLLSAHIHETTSQFEVLLGPGGLTQLAGSGD
jgi:DNA-binding GntR family transcriptional regulator